MTAEAGAGQAGVAQPVGEAGEAEESGEERVRPPFGSVFRRAWAQPLWVHAAALLLVLLALLPLMSPNSAFSSDEGAYALQVEALEAGSWRYDYKAAPYDPQGRYFPIHLSTQSESGFYPYVKHPAYPLLLQAVRRLAGPTLGLHLLALLGAVGTAAAAWLLAGELDPRLSRSSFWAAATGPVLINGFLGWAHAPSAALAGLALVGAVRIARRGFSVPATAGVAAALAAGVLLRSEALLFAVALAAALAWVRLREGGGIRSINWLALAAPAVAAAFAERAWVSSIIGAPVQPLGLQRGTVSLLVGRIEGAWHEVFGPAEQNIPAAALPILLSFGLLVGLGYHVLRRTHGDGRSHTVLVLVASATALLLAWRLQAHPYEPVTGLFAAWPLGLLGILLFLPDRSRRRDPSHTAEWPRSVSALLTVTALLFAGSVLAAQYPEGGATEWGGRFLSPLLAPLAVLAVAGLSRVLGAAGRRQRRCAVSALAGVAVAFAGFGLATVGLERARVARVAEAMSRQRAPVTVTTQEFVPRAAWPADGEVSWMRVEPLQLPRLLAELRAAGLEVVHVLVPSDLPRRLVATAFPNVTEVPEPAIRPSGMVLLQATA